MKQSIVLKMIELNVRADEIYHLGSQGIFQEEGWPDGIRDVFEDDFDEMIEVIGINPDGTWFDDVSDAILEANKFGFLVKFATPFPVKFGEKMKYPWSTYATKWFYGESYEDLCEQAIEWRIILINTCLEKES